LAAKYERNGLKPALRTLTLTCDPGLAVTVVYVPASISALAITILH
jgi:hypothetical protein